MEKTQSAIWILEITGLLNFSINALRIQRITQSRFINNLRRKLEETEGQLGSKEAVLS